jgi:hypothetical protein
VCDADDLWLTALSADVAATISRTSTAIAQVSANA